MSRTNTIWVEAELLVRRIVLLALLALAYAARPALPATLEGLLQTFQNPPRGARTHCYWWWRNGNTDEASITRDLEQMQAKGYGGAILIDANGSDQFKNNGVPAGPMFGSEAWRKLYRHAIREAARLNLEISLTIQSGWNLGSPSVTPEHASKILTYTKTVVHGPARFSQNLSRPAIRNGFYREIAVLAYPLHGSPNHQPIRQLSEKAAFKEFGRSMPETSELLGDFPGEPGDQDYRIAEIRDLSARMNSSGQISWLVPSGDWEILRIGYTDSGALVSTASGNWQGLAIDHLDHVAFETYWKRNVVPLLRDADPYRGKSLRYLVTDSWELGGTNWAARFGENFRRRRGYDLLPYLPVVAGRIAESRNVSDRFLNDFRKTIGEMIRDEHYAVFARLAKAEGLGIHPESGGPHGAPIDGLKTLGLSTFPQTEFWARSATHRSTDEDRFFMKEASSAAHTYGKVQVAGEGMTSIGPQWEEAIWNDLKPTFDQAICSGLNMLFWHTFTSSPRQFGLPGREYFAGTHLNPNVTWWNYATPFISYINRTQAVMQTGLPVSDVLYYYGDRVPNFVQLKASDPAKVLPGYDYDVVDEQVLTTGVRASPGRLVLQNGTSYRLLVLGQKATMSLAAARRLRDLVAAGAVVSGDKPLRTTGLTDDRELQSIAGEVWGDCGTASVHQHSYKLGRVYCGVETRSLLSKMKVLPDFEQSPSSDYIHRHANDADIYFVRSKSEEDFRATATFRVNGKSALLLHPDSGTMEDIDIAATLPDGRTQVPLSFEPYGSVVVVFTSEQRAHKYPKQPGEFMNAPISLAGDWKVSFPPGWNAPASIQLPQLASWTQQTDPGVRYFSGTATYSYDIEIPAAYAKARLWLDLGDVREIPQVTLNGKDVGIAWKRPFRVELTGAVSAGANHLEIAVTNLWPNRLIGDQMQPAEKRLTATNITKFRADSPLLPSGLLGPVKLIASRP